MNALTDEELDKTIKDMLLACGYRKKHKGFTYLASAIKHMYKEPAYASRLIINLYYVIAKEEKTNWQNVERLIRYGNQAAFNAGNLKKLPQFASLTKLPTNSFMITTFAQILEKQYHFDAKTQEEPIISTEELLKRALRVKLLLRFNSNGVVDMQYGNWGSELYYANPYSLTRKIGSHNKIWVKPSKTPAKLKYLTTIQTYHDCNETSQDSFNATIYGFLKQLPEEYLDEVVGVEPFEYESLQHGKDVVYSQSFARDMKLIGVRLYANLPGTQTPEEIQKQPVLYKGKRITQENLAEFLQKD